jgi:glycosyltransferase involved in cell wall biosynthesis
MIKILMFIGNLRAGGKERQAVELLKVLAKMDDVQLRVAVMNREIHYPEVFDLEVEINYLVRKVKKDPGIFPAFYKICKDFRPHIIHTWDLVTTFYAAPVARLLGARLAAGFIRGAAPRRFPQKTWLRTKLLYPWADVVIANSRAGLEANHLKPSEKNRLIYNGFDLSRVCALKDPRLLKIELGIDGRHVVGMVANLTPKKDYFTFIAAAQRLLNRRRDIVFLVVGDYLKDRQRYSIYQDCQKRVAPGFKSMIKFLGRREDVESIVSTFDVGVLTTSQIHREGISNSIMEYMALGKPVIATRGGGTQELVLEKETGFLVERGDDKKLAELIDRLLQNRGLSLLMGGRGKDRLHANFSLQRMGREYKELYTSLVGRDDGR